MNKTAKRSLNAIDFHLEMKSPLLDTCVFDFEERSA